MKLQKEIAASYFLVLGSIGVFIITRTKSFLGNSTPDELAAILSFIISGGLLLTGLAFLFEDHLEELRSAQIPGGILSLVGLCSIVVGFFGFQPWLPGQMQTLLWFLTGVVVIVGIILIYLGWRWLKAREMRYPLLTQLIGLFLGLIYLMYTSRRVGIESGLENTLVIITAIYILISFLLLNEIQSQPNSSY